MNLKKFMEGNAFDAYEYVVLDEIAENYEDIPLGKADEIAAKEGISVYFHNHTEEFKEPLFNLL